jgi:hypothetical protein
VVFKRIFSIFALVICLTILILLFNLNPAHSSYSVSKESCQLAYPEFGEVVCKPLSQPSYEYVLKNFSKEKDFSVVNLTCISHCSLDGKHYIIGANDKSWGFGGIFCEEGALERIYIFNGSKEIARYTPWEGWVGWVGKIEFDENSQLNIRVQCCSLNLCSSALEGVKIRYKQEEVMLHEATPAQPIFKEVVGSKNCNTTTFIEKYKNNRLIFGKLPLNFYISSTEKRSLPENYKSFEELQNLKVQETYSFLYGWKDVRDIETIFGGKKEDYCGGEIGNRKLFEVTKVVTINGDCYLIPINVKKEVECCYNIDCRSLNLSICSPQTFSCEKLKPCNSDFDCQIEEEYCSSKFKRWWRCDFLNPIYPYRGTCKKELTRVECCDDDECPKGYYCDLDGKCKKKLKLECPGECCISGGEYQPKNCEKGLACCVKSGSFIGKCKVKCGCKTDKDCKDDEVCINKTCEKAKLILVYVPVNWNSKIEVFDNATESFTKIFIESTSLRDCREKVKVIKVHENCSLPKICESLVGLRECAERWVTTYDRIIGLEDDRICNYSGYTYFGTDLMFATWPGSSIVAHQLGHTFGLCDENNYCSWKKEDEYLREVGGRCINQFPINECGKCCDELCCRGKLIDGATDIMGADEIGLVKKFSQQSLYYLSRFEELRC